MKVLQVLLQSAGIDMDSLRVLFEQDGATTFALTVDGDDALDLWDLLRALLPRTRRWPVIVGNPGSEDLPTQRIIVDGGKERLQVFPHTQEILKEAESIDFSALLARYHINYVAETERLLAAAEAAEDEDEAAQFRGLLEQEEEFRGLDRGPWPKADLSTDRNFVASNFRDDDTLIGKPVTMALLPCASSPEVPAVMKFGGWNACPPPAEHVAALRYWRQRYGAEIACITEDVMELVVEQPPRTREEALRLAKWQFHHCPDIVSQGTRTIDALAARLLDGEAWYFWWD
jgi:hypothetical protein